MDGIAAMAHKAFPSEAKTAPAPDRTANNLRPLLVVAHQDVYQSVVKQGAKSLKELHPRANIKRRLF